MVVVTPNVLIPETFKVCDVKFVVLVTPNVDTPVTLLTLKILRIPTDVNEELVTPDPNVVSERTSVLLTL